MRWGQLCRASCCLAFGLTSRTGLGCSEVKKVSALIQTGVI